MFRRCRLIIPIFLIFSGLLLTGCSSDNETDKSKVIASINDFKLTQDEFQKKLVKEMEYSNTYKTTPEAKSEFLQTIIKKELFIQAAQKLGLDKKKEFIRAIEQYWEATLIKLLMEEKGREILQTTSVSENEIKKKYQELKSENDSLPPFEKIEKEISKALLDIKKTEKLKEWINSLHESANVNIDSDFINE